MISRWRIQGEDGNLFRMDEGRKRVIGIMAAILAIAAHAYRRRSVRRAGGKPENGQADRGVSPVGRADNEEGGQRVRKRLRRAGGKDHGDDGYRGE